MITLYICYNILSLTVYTNYLGTMKPLFSDLAIENKVKWVLK